MVKIDLQLTLSRETIKIILEEMYKQAMTDKDRRSMASRAGWKTRRKRRQKKAIQKYKAHKKKMKK